MIGSLDHLNQKEAVDFLIKQDLWKECQMRADGRVEWICNHGVGHTIWAGRKMGKSGYTHGCDGCCSKLDLTDFAKCVEDVA